jgi:hypothetical protein
MTTPAAWTQTPKGRRLVAGAIERRNSFNTRLRKARKPVKQRSAAMRERNRQDNKLLAVWWSQPENRRCRRCGCPATDRHHMIPKSVRPDLVLEPRLWCPLCRRCHDWIKNFPAEAYGEGFLKHANEG